MNDQPTAELAIVQTSANCVSYRLVVEGRIVWRNRVYPTPAGEMGALERMAAWAKQHGYHVVGPRPPWSAHGRSITDRDF